MCVLLILHHNINADQVQEIIWTRQLITDRVVNNSNKIAISAMVESEAMLKIPRFKTWATLFHGGEDFLHGATFARS